VVVADAKLAMLGVATSKRLAVSNDKGLVATCKDLLAHAQLRCGHKHVGWTHSRTPTDLALFICTEPEHHPLSYQHHSVPVTACDIENLLASESSRHRWVAGVSYAVGPDSQLPRCVVPGHEQLSVIGEHGCVVLPQRHFGNLTQKWHF
jgi:hypothetical protein